MPKETTDKEEAVFSKLNIKQMLKSSLLHDDVLSEAVHFYSARSLREARQNAIDLLVQLFPQSSGSW